MAIRGTGGISLPYLSILAKLAIIDNGQEAKRAMIQFSSTDLANKTGDVLSAAAQKPISIARHGKPRFVVMTTEEYARLTLAPSTRQAFRLEDLSEADADLLIATEN